MCVARSSLSAALLLAFSVTNAGAQQSSIFLRFAYVALLFSYSRELTRSSTSRFGSIEKTVSFWSRL